MFSPKNLAKLEIVLALGLWAVALAHLAWNLPFIRQYLYFFAWYPYILCVDGGLWHLTGESRLWGRPAAAGPLFFWSVTVWLVFEAFNLVLRNWGYVGVAPQLWVRWPGYALAFATVLPGVLFTAQWLAAAGLGRGLAGRSFNFRGWQPVALLLGAALLILPLIFPGWAFPLVWGAFVLLLDPFCDLLGGHSLIAGFLRGRRQEGLCLLAAGLICGLWWELWNFPASSKWVYTLPALNFGKVFEMPVLGFIGFLPFALECAVMYNFLKILDERVWVTPRQRRLAYLSQLAFWLVMFAALDHWTVISYQ